MNYVDALLPGLAPFHQGLIAGLVLAGLLVGLILIAKLRASQLRFDALDAQAEATRLELAKSETQLEERDRQIAALGLEQDEWEQRLAEANHALESERRQNAVVSARLEAQEVANTQQQAWVEERVEHMKRDFEQISTKILEEKTKRFTEQNSVNIKALLDPVGEKIAAFEKRVSAAHSKEVELHGALGQQLRSVIEANEQMRIDADNLTKALTGNVKAQGNWGEVVLENVLEKSGLRLGKEYEREKSYQDDGQRKRPDAIVNLPGGRKVVIDSKVSLIAWNRFINAEEEVDRAKAISEHVTSMNAHISSLAKREYQDIIGIDTLEFVLMFVPIEAAFLEAVRADDQLFDRAFASRVVVVTPSTLLASLKTIEHLWRLESQSEGAQAVVTDAKKLHSKFIGFAEDMEELGKRLSRASDSYDSALNKLSTGRGNITGIVGRLKDRGMASDKVLPDSIAALVDNSRDDEDSQ